MYTKATHMSVIYSYSARACLRALLVQDTAHHVHAFQPTVWSYGWRRSARREKVVTVTFWKMKLSGRRFDHFDHFDHYLRLINLFTYPAQPFHATEQQQQQQQQQCSEALINMVSSVVAILRVRKTIKLEQQLQILLIPNVCCQETTNRYGKPHQCNRRYPYHSTSASIYLSYVPGKLVWTTYHQQYYT